MPLSLSLRAGEQLFINGARLRVARNTELHLQNHADFVFGRQVMQPGQADGRLRRLYRLLQDAYAGDPATRDATVDRAVELANEYVVRECPGGEVPVGFGSIIGDARGGRLWQALQALRPWVELEEAARQAAERCGT